MESHPAQGYAIPNDALARSARPLAIHYAIAFISIAIAMTFFFQLTLDFSHTLSTHLPEDNPEIHMVKSLDLSCFFFAFLAWKIWHGRDWARWILLFSCMQLWGTHIPAIFGEAVHPGTFGMMTLFVSFLLLGSCIALFSGQVANNFFNNNLIATFPKRPLQIKLACLFMAIYAFTPLIALHPAINPEIANLDQAELLKAIESTLADIPTSLMVCAFLFFGKKWMRNILFFVLALGVASFLLNSSHYIENGKTYTELISKIANFNFLSKAMLLGTAIVLFFSDAGRTWFDNCNRHYQQTPKANEPNMAQTSQTAHP